MPRKRKKRTRKKVSRKARKQAREERENEFIPAIISIIEIEASKKKFLVDNLLTWFASNKRRFYWRDNKLRPYHYVLIEIMLQKTKAETVESFIIKFLEDHEDPSDIIAVKISELENIIKPLGLYKQRAKKIKELAERIQSSGEQILATDKIYGLPGVGEYIGNMTRIMAYNHVLPIVDTNVVRVFKRFFGLETIKDARRDKKIIALAEELLVHITGEKIRDYSLALLDFGAIVCTPRKPACEKKEECCLQNLCHEYRSSGKISSVIEN
ncbi:MAG: hypothetical protein ACTSRU_13865 [Candidatus Hodarchaeales archaeon]